MVLEEVVYIEQPPDFTDNNLLNHVCRLNRALYGLTNTSCLVWKIVYFFYLALAYNKAIVIQSSVGILLIGIYVKDITVTDHILYKSHKLFHS